MVWMARIKLPWKCLLTRIQAYIHPLHWHGQILRMSSGGTTTILSSSRKMCGRFHALHRNHQTYRLFTVPYWVAFSWQIIGFLLRLASRFCILVHHCPQYSLHWTCVNSARANVVSEWQLVHRNCPIQFMLPWSSLHRLWEHKSEDKDTRATHKPRTHQ